MKLIDAILPQRKSDGTIVAYVARCQVIPAARSLKSLRAKLLAQGFSNAQIDRAIARIKT